MIDYRLFILAIFYPPSEIDLGLFSAAFTSSKGHVYFTELAERVEYGNYGCVVVVVVVGITACSNLWVFKFFRICIKTKNASRLHEVLVY